MTTNQNKKRRLGRGLEALLNPTPGAASPESDASGNEGPAKILPMRTAALPSSEDEESASTTSDVPDIQDLVFLNVHEIERNPFQPRREFSEAELASLSESLKDHDMLQPILVREVETGYQIISGERRWRAAQLAGWDRIPARLRVADDRLVAELAIVENLQRKDLNPLEKAMSFRRYLDEHDCSQEDLAGRLKIDRSTISNLMRLLDLPEIVQDALRMGSISAGHARALLPLGVERSRNRKASPPANRGRRCPWRNLRIDHGKTKFNAAPNQSTRTTIAACLGYDGGDQSNPAWQRENHGSFQQ